MSRALFFLAIGLLLILGVAAARPPIVPEIDGIAEVAAGHTALEADDLGVALWHYQRALTVIPRDPAAQLGAAIVRALRADILQEESGFLADITGLTADVMSLNELRLLSLLSWLALFVWGRQWVWNRKDVKLRRLVLAVYVLVVTILSLLVIRQTYEASYPAAVITAFEATGYAAPSEDAPILFKLYSGAEGRVLELREGWARLGLPDGREAWIFESRVVIIG